MIDIAQEFLSALQLSIQTPIEFITDSDQDGEFIIRFVTSPINDQKLNHFIKLVGARWGKDKTIIHFSLKDDNEISTLTDYLYLTRLNLENLKGVATFNKKYREYFQKMFGKQEIPHLVLKDLKTISEIFSDFLKEKKITLRELSKRTNLTQASLSRFKTGQDIRLSNFLKIVEALGLQIFLK